MTAHAPISQGQWPAWLDEATETPACRGVDTNLFFPEGRDRWAAHDQAEAAKAYCRICPLEETCREWAYAQPLGGLDGIWGGTTHHERKERHAFLMAERRREQKRRSRERQLLITHGLWTGEECAVD